MDTTVAAVGVDMRLRAAGSDHTSNSYAFARANVTEAAAFGGASSGGSLANAWNLAPFSGTYSSSHIVEIFQPKSSSLQTNFLSQSFYFDSVSNYRASASGGTTSVTTSFDALTIYIGSGTMTGSYSVYGFNK